MQIHLFGPGMLRSNVPPGYVRIEIEPHEPVGVREFARDVARRLLSSGHVARVDVCVDEQEMERWEPGPDGQPALRMGFLQPLS